jgi:hypothetical protein
MQRVVGRRRRVLIRRRLEETAMVGPVKLSTKYQLEGRRESIQHPMLPKKEVGRFT